MYFDVVFCVLVFISLFHALVVIVVISIAAGERNVCSRCCIIVCISFFLWLYGVLDALGWMVDDEVEERMWREGFLRHRLVPVE